MATDNIIYEQPLNELIRVCLRLEQLFLQVDHYLNDESIIGTRTLVTIIINLLHLLDRPDLKAKLAKELTHQMTVLVKLDNAPLIDQSKLNQTIHQLEDLSRCFIDSSGKIGQPLRDIELLNTLRLHLASPGGGCSFDIPVYHYWLNQPYAQRREMLNSWLQEFNRIRQATEILLQILRASTKEQNKVAEHGFYQELLDPQINLRLIRVAISKEISAYPEISLGRHFLSVRFFVPNLIERPSQYTKNVDFLLSYCLA